MATQPPTGMRTTWFDSVTSFFLACILMLGCLTAVLGVLWWLGDQDSDFKIICYPPVESIAKAAGVPTDSDFDTPTEAEIAKLVEAPANEKLQTISLIAKDIAASDADSDLDGSEPTSGDTSGASDHGDDVGDDIVPRFERWQIDFNVSSIKEYAQLLDFYQIELGVIGGSIDGLDCVNHLQNEKPVVRRITDTGGETRLYFMWLRSNPLADFDRRLIGRANVPTEGRQVLKFISPELENQLAVLELQAAGKKGHDSVQQIAKTTFETKRVGTSFTFQVVAQRFH